MTENEMFTAYGKKQVELDVLRETYNLLLSVLAGVVVGEIDPKRVLADPVTGNWSVAPLPTLPQSDESPVQ